MQKNPIPILREAFGIKISAIRECFPSGTPIEVMHSAFSPKPIDDRLHSELFILTMGHWGHTKDRDTKRALWQCYFDTRPHILHKLVFEHDQWHRIVKKTTLTDRMLEAYLRQPKLHQYQLRKVGRFASAYIEAISSPKQLRGRDPRYMGLAYALRDPKRMYERGEIVVD